MRQYTKTYRITVSAEMNDKLQKLKRYNIVPTAFVRKAIAEKLARDIPALEIKNPFNISIFNF